MGKLLNVNKALLLHPILNSDNKQSYYLDRDNLKVYKLFKVFYEESKNEDNCFSILSEKLIVLELKKHDEIFDVIKEMVNRGEIDQGDSIINDLLTNM